MELKTGEKIALLKSRVANLERAYKKQEVGRSTPIRTKQLIGSIEEVFEEIKERFDVKE